MEWAEWVKMGEQMKKASEYLTEKLCEAAHNRKKNSPHARFLRKGLKNLDEVRNTLDELVHAEFPDRKDFDRVFYGTLAEEKKALKIQTEVVKTAAAK